MYRLRCCEVALRRIILLAILVVIISPADVAFADIICLNNGNIIEGIIAQDTEKSLEVEVFLNARITFAKRDIAYVKEGTEKENQALRKKWLEDKKEREEAERIRQEFEAQQQAKGLVKYQDKWISESEKDKLKTKEFIDTALREKIERGEIVKSDGRKRSEIARSILARGSWHYRQSEHFIVYYEDVIQSKIVADRAEYHYEKIIYDLDYDQTIYWPEKCEVFIIPDKAKWQEYMQEFVERYDHIGGFVPQAEQKEIYLCALSLPYLSVTFPHELTHLIFADFAKGESIPLWLNEGLAIYESGLIGYADEKLRDKLKKAEHIPIRELVRTKDYPSTKEEMELFYSQAEKIVEFLITQHGRKKFSRFCRLSISGQPFERAINFVYGDKYYSDDDFKQAWIRYVMR